MALFHYTNGIEIDSNDRNVFSSSGEVSYDLQATRAADDSYLRSIWYPRVSCFLTSTVGAPLYWWVSSNVYVFWTFDPDATLIPGDPFGDDPNVLGICKLEPVVSYSPTVNTYAVDFVGPRNGVRLQTARKGKGVDKPVVITTFVATDQNAVFNNPSNYTNRHFSSVLIGRINWGSSVAPGP